MGNWLLVLLTAISPTGSTPESLPSCGVGSAYLLLACHERPAKLEELRRRFRRVNPAIDWGRISCRELRLVLESYGLPAATVRIEPSSLRNLTLPAILYVRPERVDRGTGDTGHFLVLESIEGNDAFLLDSNRAIKGFQFRMPVAELSRTWDGEAIVVERDRRGWIAAGALALAGLVISYRWHHRSRSA
jgi:ABC-type bacteriocin/lantibiotic exporter with double-glycine peptidase domain